MTATPARLLALRVALVVALLPWLVQPGVVQPDTKVDLVVSPWRYLTRSLDAWSTHSGFGELQNQAYGYLWPMGPFFGVLHSLGVPGWAAQRAWWSFILVVGFTGAALVARRVARLSATGAVAVGVVYALSARVLTLLSELSVETWPGMLMPWLVLAVWWGWRSGRHVRMLAATGVLTACLGGVNATASLVAVLGAGLFALVVTRSSRVVVTFGVGALLGAAWWLGPLVVLGGYAYPFMDFIETSRITTAVTTLPAILRGASDWVAYIVDADGHPVWQSGWVVAQGTLSILAGSALAGVGLAGVLRTNRGSASGERRVALAWWTLLMCGVLAMALPYAGTPSGPFSSVARSLLDGPLAAARNVHKLDPLVRLPLAVGVGAVWDAWRHRVASENPRGEGTAGGARQASGRQSSVRGPLAQHPLVGPGVRVGIIALVLASLAPFWQGRLGDANGVRAWPVSLRETARDLDAVAQRDGGSSLVLPSARAAEATWGSASDEPLTAFASSPIVVRGSAPLYHPGAQRLVDAIDTTLASGARDRARADAAVSAATRAGIRRLVVRWGTGEAQHTSPPQAYVAALASADGVAAHRVHGSGHTRYDVFDLVPAPATSGAPVAVLGGPESTLSLAEVGVDARRPLVTGRGDGWITDDVRRRVYANGQSVGHAYGPTLPASDRAPERLGARDLDFPGRAASSSARVVVGATSVSATSSTADPFAATYLGPGTSADAAFDASPATRWLTPARNPGTLDVRWDDGAPRQTLTLKPATVGSVSVTRIDATALDAAGRMRHLAARRTGSTWQLDVPAGTRDLALIPLADRRAATDADAIGLADVRSSEPIVSVVHLPGTVDPARTGVVLTRTHPWFDGGALASEDDGAWTRSFTVTTPKTMNLDVRSKDGANSAAGALTIRTPAGGRQRVALSGHTASLALPRGEVILEASPDVERVTLTPTSPDARARLGLAAPGPASTLVSASTQGTNTGWALASPKPGAQLVTVDGWRQGATGTPSETRLTFAPQRAHRIALVVGAGCALGCLVLLAATALFSRRRPRSAGRPATSDDGHDGPEDATHRSRTARITLACLSVVAGVAVLGWALVPVAVAAWCVPRALRGVGVVALMVAVGPVMAGLGVVEQGSLGAMLGQLFTAVGLALVSLEVCDAPSGWRVLRRGASSGGRGRG